MIPRRSRISYQHHLSTSNGIHIVCHSYGNSMGEQYYDIRQIRAARSGKNGSDQLLQCTWTMQCYSIHEQQFAAVFSISSVVFDPTAITQYYGTVHPCYNVRGFVSHLIEVGWEEKSAVGTMPTRGQSYPPTKLHQTWLVSFKDLNADKITWPDAHGPKIRYVSINLGT